MTKLFFSSAIIASALVAGCGSVINKSYSGSGGMTAYNIKPEVYTHHYTKGFTGVDAYGWDPNLQFAWSRIGAAKTCGINFDQEKAIDQLQAKYEISKVAHEIAGIDFHHMQSKKVAGFCTQERINEIQKYMPNFLSGNFPKIY